MSSTFVSKQGIAKDRSYSVLLDDGKTHTSWPGKEIVTIDIHMA